MDVRHLGSENRNLFTNLPFKITTYPYTFIYLGSEHKDPFIYLPFKVTTCPYTSMVHRIASGKEYRADLHKSQVPNAQIITCKDNFNEIEQF